MSDVPKPSDETEFSKEVADLNHVSTDRLRYISIQLLKGDALAVANEWAIRYRRKGRFQGFLIGTAFAFFALWVLQ